MVLTKVLRALLVAGAAMAGTMAPTCGGSGLPGFAGHGQGADFLTVEGIRTLSRGSAEASPARRSFACPGIACTT
jgi:hypothetical protein